MTTIAAFLDQPAVAQVLRLMCFECGGPAVIYRMDGHDIPRRAEDEQSFVLRRALGLIETHGDGWKQAMRDEMGDILDRRKAMAETVGDATS